MVPGLDTVGDFFNFGQLARSFEEYNMNVDFKTFGLDHANPDPDSIKGRLKAALNLSESDIFEVPVLYFNQDRPTVWFKPPCRYDGQPELDERIQFGPRPLPQGIQGSLAQHFGEPGPDADLD